MSMLKAALEYLAAGITTIPVATDGSKAPFTFPGDKGPFKWQPLSKKAPSEAQIRKLFKHACGIAILGGPVSGNLEIIDFDLADRFDMFAELAAGLAPGLLEQLPVVKTPNGYHLYLRAPNIQGNLKLARTREHYGNKKSNVAVETRGTGGYVLAPPSPAECHPSGKLYEHHSGPPVTAVPTLTAEQRDTLISIARSLNEVADDDKQVAHEETKPRRDDGSAKKPGEDFDERATWRDVLEPHGWEALRTIGDKTYWRRPGKKDGGISATTGHCGTKLWVFSSNAAPFEAERAYNKFSAYGLLNCGGDFSQASRELRAKGFGSPLERKSKGKRDHLEPVKPTPAKWDELNAGLDRIASGPAPRPAQDNAGGWIVTPDTLEAPPPTDDDAPPDIEPSSKSEPMTAARLEFMMDDDIAAVMRPGIFESVLAIESQDKAEWLLVCDLLRRRKQKDAFNRAVKEHKRKARMAGQGGDGWRAALTYKTNKDGEQMLERSLANIALILREDPAWRGVLALNTLSNRIVTREDTPFERDRNAPWTDNDSLATRAWLESNYGLALKTNDAHEGVILAASIQKFNPLVDYIEALESHDAEILDTWLVDIFGVEDTPYARAVGRRWMISAVARALDPGCKADCVLILEGDQGMKKSSVLAQLCPSDSWFIDGLSDFGSKDQKEEIEGKWIVELGELKGFGKELDAIKAFTSRTTEKYRPSYARFTVEAPRTCVFAGTVNPDNVGYFRDVTGNRRFWPVRCRRSAPTITPELRDRLWAEARDAYRAGFQQKERDETTKWWIDPTERELYAAALEQQESRVEVDVWHDAVAHYLVGRQDSSVNEILAHIGISLDKLKQVEGQRVGRILRMLRWEKYRANNIPGRPWRYRPPGVNLSLLPDAA